MGMHVCSKPGRVWLAVLDSKLFAAAALGYRPQTRLYPFDFFNI